MLRYAVPVMGNVELDKITPPLAWAMQRQAIEAGAAPKTVNDVTTTFYALLRDATTEGLIEPEHELRLRRALTKLRTAPEEKFAPWTVAELADIIAAARERLEPHAAALIVFLATTGARPGEALGLQWRDVHLGQRLCRIRRSRDECGVLTPCKTRRSVRDIHLAAATVAALSPLRRGAPNDFVLRSPQGQPIDPANFRKRSWRPLLEAVRATVTPRPMYALRHTFASIQLSSGNMTLAQLAAYLGDDPATASRHYARFLPEFAAVDPGAAFESAVQPLRSTNGQR